LDEALAFGFNPLNHVVRACGGAGGDIFCMRHDGGMNWRYYSAGLETSWLLGEPANRFASGQFLINFSQLAADTR
jgi:hypothetical protein